MLAFCACITLARTHTEAHVRTCMCPQTHTHACTHTHVRTCAHTHTLPYLEEIRGAPCHAAHIVTMATNGCRGLGRLGNLQHKHTRMHAWSYLYMHVHTYIHVYTRAFACTQVVNCHAKLFRRGKLRDKAPKGSKQGTQEVGCSHGLLRNCGLYNGNKPLWHLLTCADKLSASSMAPLPYIGGQNIAANTAAKP